MKEKKDLFVLINYKTKEKYVCSWFENTVYKNQQIHYIGKTNGLGGYNTMINSGFIDRRFQKPKQILTKVQQYKYKKYLNARINKFFKMDK